MKKYLLIFAAMMLVAVTVFAAGYNLDISKIADGTYTGKKKAQYDHTYKVNVVVKAGKMTSIKLENKAPSAPAKRKADLAFTQMVKKNMIDVDAETSATWKELVYNALKDNVKK